MEQSMTEAFGSEVTRAATTTQVWAVIYDHPDHTAPQLKASLTMDAEDVLVLLMRYLTTLPKSNLRAVLRSLIDAVTR